MTDPVVASTVAVSTPDTSSVTTSVTSPSTGQRMTSRKFLLSEQLTLVGSAAFLWCIYHGTVTMTAGDFLWFVSGILGIGGIANIADKKFNSGQS